MTGPELGSSTRAGTIGGCLLIVITNISSGEIVKTIVLSLIGAVISYSISYVLKVLLKKKQ